MPKPSRETEKSEPSEESLQNTGSNTGLISRLFTKTQPAGSEPVPIATPYQFPENIHKLSEIRVDDIATPLADIIALPVDVEIEPFFEALRTHGYSRFPVYNETLDDPIGLVHVKDLMMAYGTKGAPKKFALKPYIRPLIVVPPSMRVLALLQKMQAEHIHMVLVIDEFGGVDGLVTVEDIIEEIVGEIPDEHDEDEDHWKQEKPGVFLVQARTSIEDFEREAGITLPKSDNDDSVDTVGGLIMTMISRVPAKGEVIKGENGIEFGIVDADPRRIKRVRITLLKAIDGDVIET